MDNNSLDNVVEEEADWWSRKGQGEAMEMQKWRFDDVIEDGPEYHGWHLRFINGQRCIHGVAYEDELEFDGGVKITNRGIWGDNGCGFDMWSEEDDFGPIPENDALFDFALRTIKAEFGAKKVCVSYAEPEAVEILL